ncbi:F-box protein SKIP22-like [Humulus lupulus]|uniref:F-box protein SKIP22-like n=1 Tax=Humulus lupulus TaxID=3486 RepID=UPI002B403F24|nr:F-box protein SKIP22-like [Humulus lupulus]
MKLRVRSIESKETLRIELPNASSLLQLKDAIAQSISSSTSSSSLRLSLNRNDELFAPSPHDSLQSLGIASGDLIYYSIVSETSFPNSKSPVPMETRSNLDGGHDDTLGGPISLNQETQVSNLDALDDETDKVNGEGSNLHMDEGEEGFGAERMEIEGEADGSVGSKFPESCFVRRMRRVLNQGLGEDGHDHKLMVIAVHSVLLESGFVGFDLVSGTRVDKFSVLDNWKPSMAFSPQFHYTLPEILGKNEDSTSYVIETVVLKFQIMGRFVIAFGSLSSGGSGSGTYRLCLDEHKFVRSIGALSPDGDSERQVYEFWKIVKDKLVSPLLIDLCAKAGLPSPPCFVRLPSELQMKILELLPAAQIAKMGCVSKELQYLSSNNDLWKAKFKEEFGNEREAIDWKRAFAHERRKEEERRRATSLFSNDINFRTMVRRRDPNPFAPMNMVGGDYDRFPVIARSPDPLRLFFGRPGGVTLSRRSFSPNCNLRGFLG